MRSTLGVLAIMLILGLAANAGAYDFLYTGDTAMTHDAGAFGIKASFNYLMADAVYDSSGSKKDFAPGAEYSQMEVPVDVYYSVMDQLEIGIQPKFRMLKLTPPDTTRAATKDVEGTGIGDTWVKVKYMFMPEPMVTARLGFKIPTGEADPGEDELPTIDDPFTGEVAQMDLDAAVLLGLPAGPGTFDAGVGYRMRMEGEEPKVQGQTETHKYKPGDEIHFMAGYTYHLSDMMNFKVAADGYFGSDDECDGKAEKGTARTAVWVNPRFEYMMENGLMLGADFHYPLMGENVLALWGFGLSVGWGM